MINIFEANETNKMITQENLDVRTITMGISLLDCITDDLIQLNQNVYEKITKYAKNLVSTGKQIEREFGIPIVNKRISVTPIALIGGSACKKAGRLCDTGKDSGPGSPRCGCKLYRRLFCPGFQGHDSGRGEPDPLHPGRRWQRPSVSAAPSMWVPPRPA